MLHEIKIQEEFADAVLSGEKNFEVRYNDRDYRKGDFIRFKVVDGIYCVPHKLRNAEYIITYVLRSFVGLAEGYVAFGIKKVGADMRKPPTEEELGDCNICRFAGCSECDDCVNGSQWVREVKGVDYE